MSSQTVMWDSNISSSNATIEIIDHFRASNFRHLYGRGDKFPKNPTFHVDIWKDRNGRIVMRFWSRGIDVDSESYEIIGLDINNIPANDAVHTDQWIPEQVRDAYDNWIIAFMKFN